jgi:hypothetical protein
MADRPSWPAAFTYDDPVFAKLPLKVGIAPTVLGPSGSAPCCPTRTASMDAAATAMQGQGVDLSVFTSIEAYFAHQRDDDVFAEMAQKSRQVPAKQ